MAQSSEPEFVFDPGNLTLGDLEALEEYFGIKLQELMRATDNQQIESLGAKLLSALAFIVLRQRDPEADPAATVKQARAVRLTELIRMVGGKKRIAAAVKAQGRLASGPRGGAQREDPPVGG